MEAVFKGADQESRRVTLPTYGLLSMAANIIHDSNPTPSSTQPQDISVIGHVPAAGDTLSLLLARAAAPLLLRPILDFWYATALGVVTTATWASHAFILVTGLTAGGPVSWLYCFQLAASMGACAGIWTTAGGQVDLVNMMSPEGWAPCLSYATGWLSTLRMELLAVGGQTTAIQGVLGMAQLAHLSYVIEKWHVSIVG